MIREVVGVHEKGQQDSGTDLIGNRSNRNRSDRHQKAGGTKQWPPQPSVRSMQTISQAP